MAMRPDQRVAPVDALAGQHAGELVMQPLELAEKNPISRAPTPMPSAGTSLSAPKMAAQVGHLEIRIEIPACVRPLHTCAASGIDETSLLLFNCGYRFHSPDALGWVPIRTGWPVDSITERHRSPDGSTLRRPRVTRCIGRWT
jgi:hypothetical protein